MSSPYLHQVITASIHAILTSKAIETYPSTLIRSEFITVVIMTLLEPHFTQFVTLILSQANGRKWLLQNLEVIQASNDYILSSDQVGGNLILLVEIKQFINCIADTYSIRLPTQI